MWQTNYLSAQFMFDIHQDFAQLYEECNLLYYGKGWDGGMKEFRALLGKAFRETPGCMGWGLGAPLGRCLDRPGVQDQLKALLVRAEEAAAGDPDPRALMHVRREREIFAYTWEAARRTYLQNYKELNVYRKTSSITIDGELSEGDWKAADVMTGFKQPPWSRIDSPGANDNAIGTSGVLEIARVLAKHAPERTIRFLFCNEEHTPWTSKTAAQNAKQRGDRIIAVFNLDALGGKPAAETAARKLPNVAAYTAPEGARLAELVGTVNARYGIGLEHRTVKRRSPGDDDGSFVKAGYPAAIILIGSFPYGDPNYHTPEDTPERSDVPNATKQVQAALAAVLTLDQER